ncbi:MAG: manganese efflux pump MntP family protein, partial [Dehalococcoidales bacterium]|nr:manganese efflux pump MntP family protein [Dehalococcoidales bacterium]
MDAIDFPSVVIIALALSADCFAVAISTGVSRKISPGLLRLPLLFGIFQSLMTAAGWAAGKTIVELISGYDHWVAFGLLAAIGGKMVWESLRSGEKEPKNLASWLILITLSLATSIDALAVGLSFAFLRVNIVLAVITIGLTAFLITLLGIPIGRKVG